jgi:hypothetical protein
MFGISKLSAAVNALVANVTALAETIGQVNAGLRQRTGLDAPEAALGLPEPPPAEGEAPARRNGRAVKAPA